MSDLGNILFPSDEESSSESSLDEYEWQGTFHNAVTEKHLLTQIAYKPYLVG